jgi:hypothetical protein
MCQLGRYVFYPTTILLRCGLLRRQRRSSAGVTRRDGVSIVWDRGGLASPAKGCKHVWFMRVWYLLLEKFD